MERRGLSAILAGMLLTSVPAAQEPQAPAVGERVPDFAVTDLSGKRWSLAELRKRTASGVVSLTFWCTFCHSCRMMDARFQKAEADFKGQAAVLAIDSSAADTAKKVDGFVREKKFTVPVFMDPEGKAADLFGVRVTTTTVVIDAAGVLRYRGRFDVDGIPHARNALRAVLDGKEVAVRETPPAG
jgi:peroxiredoxin